MNMIRVWGGGVYEDEAFYDLCDRLGLMVWQDFMFACGEYPEAPWFLAHVRDEAEKAVSRLRNHPSIVLWCGNNECEWLYCTEHPRDTPDDMSGARVFRDILPAVIRRLDGTRPYWRSSPFGEGFPNAVTSGNHHQWEVWSLWKDYTEYEKDNARFVTEFGFQAPPHIRTLEEVTLPADRHAQSRVMEHHNKQVEGTERLIRFIAAHHRLPGNLSEFVDRGQLVQAEALRCAAEHWRRRKYLTAGVLFWQLNDCWPVTSWSVIDSRMRPKASWYYARRFYAPLLVSFRKRVGRPEVWLTSDMPVPVSGTLEVTLFSFGGRRVKSETRRVRAEADASLRVMRLGWKELDEADTARHYLRARLMEGGAVLCENRLALAEPKRTAYPDPGLRWSIRRASGGTFAVTLRAKMFARAVRLDVERGDALFDDDAFDLDAGAEKIVLCTTPLSLARFRRSLRVRSLR